MNGLTGQSMKPKNSAHPQKRRVTSSDNCTIQPGAAPSDSGATLSDVPTAHPRYTITDTGSVRDLLDDAQRCWPEIVDRKKLLLRLAQTGHDALNLSEADAENSRRIERQRAALAGLQRTVDWDAIRNDQAWS
jgi:hypothetical protein